MKTKQGIIISSEGLRLAFVEASKVKPSKDLSITESYLIECKKNKCWLVRTNLEDTIKIELNCEWNFEGSFLIDPDIATLFNKIDEQPISIHIHAEYPTKVYLIGDDFETSFETDHPDDFPITVKGEFREIGGLRYNAFRETLGKLSPFLCKDPLKLAMAGYCIDDEQIAATDGHRLRWIKSPGIDCTAPKAGMEAFQPANELVIRNILPYLRKKAMKEDWIQFSRTDDILKIESFGRIIYTTLIDKPYPTYRNVIPMDFNTTIEIENKVLSKVLEQSLIFANKITSQIMLTINSILTVRSEDLGFREFQRDIPLISKEGDDVKIGINGRLALECLKHLPADVKMDIQGPNRAIVMNDELLLMTININ